MKKNILNINIFILFFAGIISVYSQVGIKTTSPATTLDIRGANHTTSAGIVSAKDGLLVPRVNALTTNGTQNGQLVYVMQNATVSPKSFYYWNSTAWTPIDTEKEPWYKVGSSPAAQSYSNTDDIYTNGKISVKTGASDLSAYTVYSPYNTNTATNYASANLDINGGLRVVNVPQASQNSVITPVYVQTFVNPSDRHSVLLPGFIVKQPLGYSNVTGMGNAISTLSTTVATNGTTTFMKVTSNTLGASNIYFSGKNSAGQIFSGIALLSYSLAVGKITGKIVATSNTTSGNTDTITYTIAAGTSSSSNLSSMKVDFAGGVFSETLKYYVDATGVYVAVTNSSTTTNDIALKSKNVF